MRLQVAPMVKRLCVFHLLSVTTTEVKFFVCVLCLRVNQVGGEYKGETQNTKRTHKVYSLPVQLITIAATGV